MKRLVKVSFLQGLSLIFLCVFFSSANGQGKQKIIDTFDRFLQYWDRTRTLPDQERIKWFKTEVISQAPDLYEALFRYTNDQTTPDERILSNLKKFPEIEHRSREIYQQLSLDIGSNLKSFSTAFPDFDPSACDIVILHSLNGSNGAVLDVKDRCVFYLGIDAIAANNDWSNQTPFFHHEFFHAYHFTKFKPDKFYSFLWMEGLAVYVAKSLNPRAINAELMLDAPKGLISKVKPHLGMVDKKSGQYITFGYYDPRLKKNITCPVEEIPPIYDAESARHFRNNFLRGIGAKALRAKKQAQAIAEFNNVDGWKNDFKKWRKRKAPNSYLEDVSRLNNWVFKFFVHERQMQNPATWPTAYVDFENWILKTKSERNNTRGSGALAANTVNHVCSSLNVYLDFLEERKEFAPIKHIRAIFNQRELPKKSLAHLYSDEQIKNAPEEILKSKHRWAERTAQYWKILAATGMRASEPLGLHLESIAFGEIGEDHVHLVEHILEILEIKDIKYYGFIILRDQPELGSVRAENGIDVPRKPLKSKPDILPRYNRYIPILDREMASLLLELAKFQETLFEKRVYGSDRQNYLLLDGLTYGRASSCLRDSIFKGDEYSGGDKIKRFIHELRHTHITKTMLPIARGKNRNAIAKTWVGQERDETTDKYDHEAELYENRLKSQIRSQTLDAVVIAPVGKRKPDRR